MTPLGASRPHEPEAPYASRATSTSVSVIVCLGALHGILLLTQFGVVSAAETNGTYCAAARRYVVAASRQPRRPCARLAKLGRTNRRCTTALERPTPRRRRLTKSQMSQRCPPAAAAVSQDAFDQLAAAPGSGWVVQLDLGRLLTRAVRLIHLSLWASRGGVRALR